MVSSMFVYEGYDEYTLNTSYSKISMPQLQQVGESVV
jgi:hypothetical protein